MLHLVSDSPLATAQNATLDNLIGKVDKVDGNDEAKHGHDSILQVMAVDFFASYHEHLDHDADGEEERLCGYLSEVARHACEHVAVVEKVGERQQS